VSPDRRRVVITGLGTVTAAGTGLDAFWDWVCSPTDEQVHGQVRDFDPSRWLTRKELKRTDPFARYAVGAAQLAVDDAGTGELDPLRTGVVLSTVYGALESFDEQAEIMAKDGPDAVSPFLTALSCENAGASLVSLKLGLRGASKAIVGACAGGAYAVADAADLIRLDRCDAVLAGGSQGAITPLLMAAYRNLRVLSTSGWSRPFDRRRDGFVFAEGAAVLLLEERQHALDRGARIYAEVLGAANTNDAASMVSPSGSGAEECIRLALADAGLTPAEIGHVNAHGTGTMLNDLKEAEALHAVFGPEIEDVPPVTSIKRVTGHAAGASGAYEAVAAALTIHRAQLPPVGIEVEPDPELQVPLVIGPAKAWVPAPVLSNSFGLGGHNGCLVLSPA
jgi:3-oxoacyl-[acyl-carrier-protein] synthase II